MPDLNLCIKNRRKNLSKIWRSKEWKEARTIFLSFHPDKKCARCGRVGTIVPGHSSEDYNDMETYIQKVRDNECPPLCPTCNLMEMKGRKPCPSCIKKFHKGESDRIRYITQDQETCYICSPSYDLEKKRIKKEERQRLLRKLNQEKYLKAKEWKKNNAMLKL